MINPFQEMEKACYLPDCPLQKSNTSWKNGCTRTLEAVPIVPAHVMYKKMVFFMFQGHKV